MNFLLHRVVPSVTALGLLSLPLSAQAAAEPVSAESRLRQALGDASFAEVSAPQFEAAVAVLLAKAGGNLKAVNAIMGAAVRARPDLRKQTINAAVAAMTPPSATLSAENLQSMIRLAATSDVSNDDAQAKELLKSTLPAGVTLSSASDAQMEEAVKAAVTRDPRLAEGVVRVAIIAKVPSEERMAPAPAPARARPSAPSAPSRPLRQPHPAPRGDGKSTVDGKSTAANASFNPWGAKLSGSFALIAATGEAGENDTQAKELLAASLPKGVTLSSASDMQMEEAVKTAVSRDPRLAEGVVRVAIIAKVPSEERMAPAPAAGPDRAPSSAPRRIRRAPAPAPRGDGKSTVDGKSTADNGASGHPANADPALTQQPFVFIAANAVDADSYVSAVIAAAVSAAPDQAAAIVSAATTSAPAFTSTISQSATKAAPSQSAAIAKASAAASAAASSGAGVSSNASGASASYVDAVVNAAVSAAPNQAAAIVSAALGVAPAFSTVISQSATEAAPSQSAAIAQASAAANTGAVSASESYVNSIVAAAIAASPSQAASIIRAAVGVAPAYSDTIYRSVGGPTQAYVNAVVAAAVSASPDQAATIAAAAAAATPQYAASIAQTAISIAPPAQSGAIAQAVAAVAPDQATAIIQVASQTTAGSAGNNVADAVTTAASLNAANTASSIGQVNPGNINGSGTDTTNLTNSPSDQTNG